MSFRLSWCVLLLLTLPALAEERTVEVRLDLREAPSSPVGELVVRGAEASSTTYHPLRSGLQVTVPGGTSTISCRGQGLWCPVVAVDEDTLILPVFPAMTVLGRLTGQAVLIESITSGTVQAVVGKGGPGAESPIELRRDLEVEDGTFSVPAPRTRLDLRFAFPGSAPVYRWGASPPEDPESTELDLGALEVHPGGSLIGWVQRREDELPLEGAVVQAVPATANPDVPPWERTLLDVETTTGETGFFQLSGLRPGTYRVEIGASGRVPEVLEPVEVEAASETVLGTVSVSPPLKLSVQVFPPVAPDGRPWTLMLAPLRPLPGEDLHRAAVGEDGTAELTSIRPADYVVRVMDEGGSALLVEEHEIRGDGWLTLQVPVVRVEGVVRQGGEPVEARLRLETGKGDQTDFRSGESGIFRGWMRRPTRPWLMATVTWTEGSESRNRVVEVIPEMDAASLFLEVDLPAGSIVGQVVDEVGQPRPGVRVLAVPAERYSQWTRVEGQTDRNGRFRLTGLDETRHLVRAGGRQGPASEVEEVDLGGLFPVGEVQLVLRPTRPLTGRVTHGGQPVPGAAVLLDGLGATPVSRRTETDPEGRFQITVPESMRQAVATVVAPSHALWSGCVAVGEGLTLALPDTPTGVVEVTAASGADVPPRLGGDLVLVTGDGGFIPLSVLIGWSRTRGGRFEMDRGEEELALSVEATGLVAGSYAFTWSSEPPWVLGARTCAGAVQDAEWNTLPPGGVIHLRHEAEPENGRSAGD